MRVYDEGAGEAGDAPEPDTVLSLDTSLLLDALQRLNAAEDRDQVRHMAARISEQCTAADGPLQAVAAGADAAQQPQVIELRQSHLVRDLEQIARAHTLERARYYIQRLIRGITEEPRTNGINDIDLNRWKEYEEVYTDSLWNIERRDRSGAHTAQYWGNFIPQIPHQMMLRYTKQGEWVLDTFAGLGTTLIEGQRLGRHTLGIELQPDIADQARERIAAEPNPCRVQWDIVTADSTTVDYRALLQNHGQHSVQLVMMHPPYFDIIKFSQHPRDLGNAPSLADFLAMMGQAVDNAAAVLDQGRYLVLVIGDKYAAGEWIPLGFQTMQEVTRRGFTLKSIIVKNFEQTTGKRSQKELWRYRALVGGFYIFKHEYIFLFKKN